MTLVIVGVDGVVELDLEAGVVALGDLPRRPVQDEAERLVAAAAQCVDGGARLVECTVAGGEHAFAVLRVVHSRMRFRSDVGELLHDTVVQLTSEPAAVLEHRRAGLAQTSSG